MSQKCTVNKFQKAHNEKPHQCVWNHEESKKDNFYWIVFGSIPDSLGPQGTLGVAPGIQTICSSH